MRSYKVVTHKDISELEKEVSALLNSGWTLAGGVSVAYTHEHAGHEHVPGHLVFAQSLEKQ
jgi:hypothetical protein